MLAGNWKMHTTRAEATALIEGIAAAARGARDREVVVGPPFTLLETAKRVIGDAPIGLAAQHLHWEPKGAFTGEISGEMLHDIGCSHVIIGHSERRQYFGETDATVSQRLGAALRVGLHAIVCVGETLEQRESNQTLTVIETQIRGGLQGLDAGAFQNLTVAYEPVWAIGTGKVATTEQAEEVHAAVRRQLGALVGGDVAETVRILYGGSVKPDNVDALMAQPNIDGALVGGASLDPKAFTRIIEFLA